MTRPWRSWAAAMACLVVPWVARAPLVARQATARELPAPLRAAREVTGGARWDEIREITAEGTKTSFGLTGRFRSREDLATGEFEARADYGLLANGEGVDRAGRWRQDDSRSVHPLDSPEAREVAATESYLARRGYFFPQRAPAAYRELGGIREGTRRFDRLEATPAGGRAATLWIDRETHLLDRAVMTLSVGEKTLRYADYRTVDGLLLPFALSVEHGDEAESGTAALRWIRVATTADDAPLARPASDGADASIAAGAAVARARGFLDPRSGFFVVEARLDGKGPFPFILDTGGHDILTPAVADELGLQRLGHGFSRGAGAGTTSTEFAQVASIALGEATISAQPFTILHLDLGMAQDGEGGTRPLAGILGLEVFERFAVTLDAPGREVLLRRDEVAARELPGNRLPLCFTSDMPLVAATLDGRPGWFEIDTGNNTDLIVFRQWARSVGLAADRIRGAARRESSVGGELELQPARARNLRLGDLTLARLPILLAGENAGSLSARFEAGNLGTSILARFRPTFDYRAETLILEP